MMASPRPPRGVDSVKADNAGRVKLTSTIQSHIQQLPDKSLFATVLFGQLRIYTNGSWERNLDRLSSQPALRKSVYELGNMNGADVVMDSQGRITFPQKIREMMPIEGKVVSLVFIEDVLMVRTQEQQDEHRVNDARVVEENKDAMTNMGFV